MLNPSPRAVLNHLIESCRDAERGFRHAATLMTHWTMRSEFKHAADLRAQCAIDLLPHAHRLGGAATAEGTAGASMHKPTCGLVSIRGIIPIVLSLDHGVSSQEPAHGLSCLDEPPPSLPSVTSESLARSDANPH